MKYIILLILGIASVIFSIVCNRLSDESNIHKIKTDGVITGIVDSGSGYVQYFVDISVNGQIVTGESIHYTKAHNKYYEGDVVQLEYYYSANKRVMVEIDDDELIPCKNSFDSASKILLVAGIIFIVIYVVLFLYSIFI